jgi:hypothetical protein
MIENQVEVRALFWNIFNRVHAVFGSTKRRAGELPERKGCHHGGHHLASQSLASHICPIGKPYPPDSSFTPMFAQVWPIRAGNCGLLRRYLASYNTKLCHGSAVVLEFEQPTCNRTHPLRLQRW